MAISLYPDFSLQVFIPEATEITKSMNSSSVWAMDFPSTMTPALKSIHPGLAAASWLLVDIFAVGTNVPKGVPRPVVNSTIWQPAAASAVEATRSFPGALSRFSPFSEIRPPYPMTPIIGDLPDFCVHPIFHHSVIPLHTFFLETLFPHPKNYFF